MNNKIIAAILTALVLAYGGYEWYGGEEPIYPGAPGDSWCSSDFAKRIDINVNNTAGSALTDYQVYVNLSSNPINETSLRVYNATSCTLRPHWTENETGGDSYGVWINYSSIAASSWTNNTAIYYDNASVSSASNGDNTFELFDDFDTFEIGNPTLDTAAWGDSVLVSGTYYMFYADGSGSSNIRRTTTSDFKQFDPDPGTIVMSGVHGPAILKDCDGITPIQYDGKYWMAYTKGAATGIFIASATSITGTWTEDSKIIDNGAGGSWDDADIDTPSIVKDGSTYYIFYQGYDGSVWKIGYANASTPNGTWTKSGDNPILSPSVGQWDDDYVIDPVIRKFDSTYYLFYTGRNGANTDKNGYATSNTITGTWSKYASNPILSGEAGKWDVYVTYPNVFKIGTTFYQNYDGHDGVVFAKKGLATTDSLTGTWTKYAGKWEKGGSPSVSSGELLINAAGEYIRSNDTFQYKALRARVKYPGTLINYHYFGFMESPAAGMPGEMFFSKSDPDLKVYSGQSAWTSTSVYDAGYCGSYHLYDILWKSDEAKFYIDDSLKETHTTNIMSSSSEIGFYDFGETGDLYADWVLVRNYASPEPSATLGSEEDAPATTPVISNVTNGSISATSQWIDWDVNQTTHNQVVYDKGDVGADSTACEGQWSATHGCANASDGNWSSYAESAGAMLAYAYFNYTVPTGASQAESLWHVKDSPGQANLTIPSACWGGILYLRAMGSDIGNSITWQCDNGPGWTTLRSSVANIAYEQEMKFKYVSTWDNSTAVPNITLSGLIASTLYEYQVWSYNTTNTSLSDNSSTMNFTTAAGAPSTNPITITGGKRALFCNWSYNTTFANIAANLTNCTDFFYYNSTSQKWIFYNVNRTINANTVIHKHAAIFVCFNNTTTVECNILSAETITIPSNIWYYTALRESASKTLTEINAAITADGCTITDSYAWNSPAGAYTNTGSYSVLPNEGFAIYCSVGCSWDGGI